VGGAIPAQFSPETPDEIISASVNALLGHHRMKVPHLAERIDGLKKSTLYNRLSLERSWEAREVAAIAEFFGLDVGQLYSGNFRAIDSVIADHPVRLSRKSHACFVQPGVSAAG